MANPTQAVAAERPRVEAVHPLAATMLAPDGPPFRPPALTGPKPQPPTTRVVADVDAVSTGETMRPAAAGLPERGPLPPLAALRPAASAPSAPSELPPDSSDDLQLPKRRSSLVMWIAVAAVLGGAAALFASPSLRKLSPGDDSAARPAATAHPPPSAIGIEKQNEAPSAAPPGETTALAAQPAKAATAEPAATAAEPATTSQTAATAASPSAAPHANDQGAEVDPAVLAALQPGQGYLYVASPLSTNVYLYGNLAGTTNQRITTKCGPRFIRLGTELGKWQTEGLVQIVKCGAVTRVEMGQ